MPVSALTHLECSLCGREHDADVPQGTCVDHVRPLLARYDLAAAARTLTPGALAGREPTLWRYRELLPVRDDAHVVTLGEGMTPLLPVPRLAEALGVPGLLVKDEGVLPTGSFKARGAAVGVSRAKELGIRRVAMPTNGNAGGAWATYCARAGLESLITMPVGAPPVTRVECDVTGARLFLVDGLIGDAGAMVADLDGWFLTATLKEPYRLEGKKTMGLELAEQLGWRVPDVVVYPTGGGVGLIGIAKGLRELAAMGLVEDRLPRFVAVQSTGCAPVVRAFEAGEREAEPWQDARTVAFGITVPSLIGDRLVLDALHDGGGTALAVEDEALLEDQSLCARLEGLFVCPEGAACLTAVRRLAAAGWLRPEETVVVVNTGTGLKYPELVTVDAPVLAVGDRVPLDG
jgi:threonine synthase